MSENYVIIPTAELEKLEEARLKLWQLLKDLPFLSPLRMDIQNEVTDCMWKLANTKWPKADHKQK